MSFKLFSGSSNQPLAKQLADLLHIDLGKIKIENFPDNEIGIEILESVRGKTVFVMQSIANRPNHYLMELLIMIDALKRASAGKIIAVVPYFGYARQDRRGGKREAITARLIADLLEKAGIDQMISVNLHTDQIEGFFTIPVDNLYPTEVFTFELKKLDLQNPIIVSPDVGSNKLARRFAVMLNWQFAMVDKERINAQTIEIKALIGEVKGKEVVLVDDICSTGNTLLAASRLCLEGGAKKVFAAVTHGLCSKQLTDNTMEKIFFTNSVQLEGHPKVHTISIAPLLADAIQKVVSNCSYQS